MGQLEIPLMNEFLISYRHSRVRLFRRNVFKKTVEVEGQGKITLKAGIKGQADCYGYLNAGPGHSYAVPFEIEFKSSTAIISKEQQYWRAFCEEFGIPHIVLRAGLEETAFHTVTRWTSELHKFVLELV